MIPPDELESLLRAHAYLQVERPPALWGIDADLERFLFVLGELIVVGLGRVTPEGGELGDLTLNVANVVVPPDAADERLPEGEFVAVTILAPGAWGRDDVWRPGDGPTTGLLVNVAPRADDAGAVLAYTRNLGDRGSATVFFPRAG